MGSFLTRRLVLSVPVLLGVATLVFSLIHMIPGDPAQAMLGETASATLGVYTSARLSYAT